MHNKKPSMGGVWIFSGTAHWFAILCECLICHTFSIEFNINRVFFVVISNFIRQVYAFVDSTAVQMIFVKCFNCQLKTVINSFY